MGEKEENVKKFIFTSEYYGSHPERDGDVVRQFVFDSTVDISRWDGVTFQHGTHSESEANRAFEAWLETLKEGVDYIER